MLKTERSTILLDPFFSRPSFGQEGSTEDGFQLFQTIMELEETNTIDAIFVSHSHFDHAIDAGVFALASQAQVYGSQTTCFITQAQGLPAERCTILKPPETITINEISVDAIRSPHWWSDAPQGLAGSFAEYTEIPDPQEISTAPNGGMLSYMFTLFNRQIFFQSSMDSIDAQDGSGEDFRKNLSGLFDEHSAIDLWMLCADCLEEQSEIEEYVAFFHPKNSLLMHWDAPNPINIHGLEDGVPPGFFPSMSYLNALQDSMIWQPKQYFQKYRYTEGAWSEQSSALQEHFFPLDE